MSLFGCDWRIGWFGMFTAYFDASGHPNNTDSLVVAGLVSPVQQWIKFDKSWQRVLDEYGVSSLHMKDFAHSRGEFASWKNDDLKRSSFLKSLIAVLKRSASYSFASGVDMPAYKTQRVVDVDSRLSPYAIGGLTVINNALLWSESLSIPRTDLGFVFEDGDKGKGNLLDLASMKFKISPSFEPKDRHMAFQAADLLAYEVFQTQGKIAKLDGNEKIDIDSLRKPFQSLRGIPGSDKWGFKNEEIFSNAVKGNREQ
jgi:hypothetical protein